MTPDLFWTGIAEQLARVRLATSVDDVLVALRPPNKAVADYIEGKAPDAAGFFGGSGGNVQLWEALDEAGWRFTWLDGRYHYEATAPDGSRLRYCEGDVYRVLGVR